MTWYNDLAVQYEMVKFTKYRETVLLTPKEYHDRGYNTRMLRIHSPQHLQFIMRLMGWVKNNNIYNIYSTLATYKDGIPLLDHNSIFDKKLRNKEWKETHYKNMVSYDFLLDIDSDSHKNMDYALDSAKEIKRALDLAGCPHELRFSGMGFHFVIPFYYFIDLNLPFDPNTLKNIYNLYKNLAISLHKDYSEMIDLTIYDSRRVVKVPYSLAIYKDDAYVCLPIKSYVEFNNFSLENMHFKKFDPQLDIRGRDSYIFNHEGKINKLLNKYELLDGIKW